jgi:LPXTG-motif cell wall-anchored protein
MGRNKLAKTVGALVATLTWAGSAAATPAGSSYGSVLGASAEAPNTGLSPVSILPYVALLIVGLALLALSRRRSHFTR